ncbi:hypothetical protein BC831DRAFT_453374 [Entophlyctis helioformis]|nr:hypothetical protein BC831DRAFT_453374 [Entophlyctis helioformis]
MVVRLHRQLVLIVLVLLVLLVLLVAMHVGLLGNLGSIKGADLESRVTLESHQAAIARDFVTQYSRGSGASASSLTRSATMAPIKARAARHKPAVK